MHFGAAVREILTASCGRDLREASPGTPLPSLESPTTLRTLAANLELTFGIEVRDHDLPRLRTVRDVLQCVRLRRFERRLANREAAGATDPATQPPSRPLFVAPTRDPRERFIRYTPRAAHATPASAVERTSKRI